MIRSSPSPDIAVRQRPQVLMLVGERRGQETASGLIAAGDGVAAAVKRAALGAVETIRISEAFANRETALQTVRLTCASPVVVFDCEHFEPAILFLIGIRGAVRRGVSICVVAPTSYGSGQEFIPYHLQGVACLSVAANRTGDFASRLAQLIKASIEEMRHDEEYADLPAYHAVRRPGSSAKAENLLVLRPFAPEYERGCWQGGLGPALKAHFDLRLPDELHTARLWTDSLHASLRDHAYCAADWTLLRPDLFYELGVRSASSDGSTLHIIARAHSEAGDAPRVQTALGLWPCPPSHAGIAIRNAELVQTAHLQRLFQPTPYTPDKSCGITITHSVDELRSGRPSFASDIRQVVRDLPADGSSS